MPKPLCERVFCVHAHVRVYICICLSIYLYKYEDVYVVYMNLFRCITFVQKMCIYVGIPQHNSLQN